MNQNIGFNQCIDFLMHEALTLLASSAKTSAELLEQKRRVPVHLFFARLHPDGEIEMEDGRDHVSYPEWAENVDGVGNNASHEWNQEVRSACRDLTAFAAIFIIEATLCTPKGDPVHGVMHFMSCHRGNRILMVPSDPSDAPLAKTLCTDLFDPSDCNLKIFEGVFDYLPVKDSDLSDLS